jgi:hypothetical protein
VLSSTTIDSYICKSEDFSDRGNVSEPNNIFIGFGHDPITHVLSKRQAVSSAFNKGECNGVWYCTIRKAFAVLQMLKHYCVEAQKNPPCHS